MSTEFLDLLSHAQTYLVVIAKWKPKRPHNFPDQLRSIFRVHKPHLGGWTTKSSPASRGRRIKVFGLLAAAGLVSGLLSITAFAQQPKAPAAATAPSSQPVQRLSPEERHKREEWQKSMSQIPVPKKGCFSSSYPSLEWHEVPCGQPSKYPNPPAGGPRPNIVGNGNDISAMVSGPKISSAIGSFDSVTPATVTESGLWGGNPNAANAFTLQINSQFFSTPACNGVAGCLGWQQFIYSQNQCSGPCVFMEYWLINFGPSCPAGPWMQSGNNCWFNSGNAPAPAVTAAQLQGTTLTGTTAGGTDTVTLTSAGGTATAMAADSVVSLELQWNTAEFNVFGDCCSSQANFGPGTTVVTRTRVINGTTAAPTCVAQGFTGETNNLSFGPTAPVKSPPGPAVIFTTSSAGGSASNCAAATTLGGNADLAITKFGPPSAVAGGLLTYSVNVTNHGPDDATTVVVTDTLPGSTTFLTSSIPCPGGTCTLGNLANGASTSFTITVRVSASLLSNLGATATNITNTATVNADQFDPNPSNNTATASTLVTESADMALTKTCKPDTPAQAGTSAFCDIQVANLGVSDAQNVVVTDAIVSNTSFTVTSVTGAAASCTTSASSLTSATATCNLLTVATGGGTIIHVAFTSNNPSDINDTATVKSTTPDPVGGNNAATGRVSFFASADLAISKRATPDPVVAGSNLRYTIIVRNAGPSSASNVVVKDTLPAEVRVLTVSPSVGSCTAGIPGNPLQPLTCTIGALAEADFATIAVEASVDSRVPAWRVINNNATVSSGSSDPNNGNNSATAAVIVFPRCFKCGQLEGADDDEKLSREDEER
jgi:uncharacterized repeat protein (TIGR01451 family)